MKQCKCEHWQQCPVCMPHRFDADGNCLPPEPTPLQACQAQVRALTSALFQAQKPCQTCESLARAVMCDQASFDATPVAWMVYTLNGKSVCITDNPEDFTDTHRALPLYTNPPHPPQRKPLTDEEMRECFTDTNTAEPLAEGWPGLERFARAIERAHGIGANK